VAPTRGALGAIRHGSEQVRILAAHTGLKASWRVRGPGYEDPWNVWNGVRTVFSFLAFLAPKPPGFIVWLHPYFSRSDFVSLLTVRIVKYN
jgi:hypothetical protein